MGEPSHLELPRSVGSRCWEGVLTVTILALVLRTFFIFAARVPTPSMAPTFQPGDRIFVDRITLNFRSPRSGECVVLKTSGLDVPEAQRPGGAIFVKRLAGLPGDRVRLGRDGQLEVNGRLASQVEDSPWARLYARRGRGEEPPFLGYLNQEAVALAGGSPGVAPRFPGAEAVFTVGEGRVFVLGDHSVRSLDSRTWGDVPAVAVIGRVLGR